MKMKKRMSALLLLLLFCGLFRVTVSAHEAPDISRNGSISVAMLYDGEAVPGGILSLYRAGAIYEEDGNYSFVLTGDFAESGISLDDITSPNLAESLAEYASSGGQTGTELEISGDGRAVFAGIEPGLYLVVQTVPADGYEAISPFLVSVPMNEDGIYIYDVDASPKMSTLTEKEPVPDTPEAPNDPTLPQTGQLKWPIPILAALGLSLFLIGWVLRFGKKGKIYEA